MRQIILASTSPRRKVLLTQLKVKFKVVNSGYREIKHKKFSPEQLVKYLALGKARAAAKKYSKAIIIAADTVVEFRGRVLGKPKNKADAFRILQSLSGKINYVVTGYVVLDAATGTVSIGSETTKVYMQKLSAKIIQDYIATGDPMDKAGAYASWNKKIVKKIEGDKNSAIGLPLKKVRQVLKSFKII